MGLSPASAPRPCPDSTHLVIQHRVNVRDDLVLLCLLDGVEQVLLATPVRRLGALLVKLAEVPEVVAAGVISERSELIASTPERREHAAYSRSRGGPQGTEHFAREHGERGVPAEKARGLSETRMGVTEGTLGVIAAAAAAEVVLTQPLSVPFRRPSNYAVTPAWHPGRMLPSFSCLPSMQAHLYTRCCSSIWGSPRRYAAIPTPAFLSAPLRVNSHVIPSTLGRAPLRRRRHPARRDAHLGEMRGVLLVLLPVHAVAGSVPLKVLHHREVVWASALCARWEARQREQTEASEGEREGERVASERRHHRTRPSLFPPHAGEC